MGTGMGPATIFPIYPDRKYIALDLARLTRAKQNILFLNNDRGCGV
jgi:hypothetical protein